MGTEHPDGVLSFNDKFIFWDSKSKEMEVTQKEHIKQFDRYIITSEKLVSSIIVVGQSFSSDSADKAM